MNHKTLKDLNHLKISNLQTKGKEVDEQDSSPQGHCQLQTVENTDDGDKNEKRKGRRS